MGLSSERTSAPGARNADGDVREAGPAREEAGREWGLRTAQGGRLGREGMHRGTRAMRAGSSPQHSTSKRRPADRTRGRNAQCSHQQEHCINQRSADETPTDGS